MLEQLKEKVYIANQDLMEMAAYPFSWVSVSAIDREHGLVIMMPDGGAVTEEDMAVVDMNGQLLEGKEPPVVDTAVHLALYRYFPEIGSVAHPYSRWATVFAQLDLSVPTLGIIHAETFRGDIPSTRIIGSEIPDDSGDPAIADAIARRFSELNLTPKDIPAILVTCHGAYTFGADARTAVLNAAVLEEASFLAYHTLQLDPGIRPMQLAGRKYPSK